MASIDKIDVGGTTYNINLPSTATPSITGLTAQTLTVTGDATIEGTLSTAAAATISKELTVGGSLQVNANSNEDGFVLITGASSGSYTSPAVRFVDNINSYAATLGQDIASKQFIITAFGGSMVIRALAGALTLCAPLNQGIKFQQGGYTCSVPGKSGTLALTSDIPDVPTLSAISSTDINLMFI